MSLHVEIATPDMCCSSSNLDKVEFAPPLEASFFILRLVPWALPYLACTSPVFLGKGMITW